jgi:hypothetical protein
VSTQNYDEARDSLPVELVPVFEQMLEEYKFSTTLHHGRGVSSPKVIAEMVRAGWRPSGEPIGGWAKKPKDD